MILLNDNQCNEPPDSTPAGIPLHVYLEDERGRYDMQLTEQFPQVWGKDTNNDLQVCEQRRALYATLYTCV